MRRHRRLLLGPLRSRAPRMTDMVDDDLTLLRSFEPVVRFTRGEYFFPVSVERYVEHCTLWSAPENDESKVVAPAQSLDLDELVERSRRTQGIGESLSGIVDGAKASKASIPSAQRPPRLKGGSRLAAVGLLARVIDSLNRVSLLFRGSVPGGSAARSYLLQQRHLAPDEPTYYGRVSRDGDWIVCQYWYFYAFNNWRSAFGGVNEHEADWEQVTIYLDGAGDAGAGGLPEPRWVVFSAHDETGDDLRRRWDDPDLTVVGDRHPVVFAGAGSHSGAYLAGDYLITIPAPTLGGLIRTVRWIARVLTPWSRTGQDTGVGIPYVDYARGDGRTIGSGGDRWHPVLIHDQTPWVRDFRGLWGHDTRDRLGGERGPAGPRYERDGTVRESWADPVGWAGMAKVAPNPTVEGLLMAARADQLERKVDDLRHRIAGGRNELELAAAGKAPSAPEVRALALDEEQVLHLRMELARLEDDLDRIRDTQAVPRPQVDPHAHLRHRRTPLVSMRGVRSRALAGWAVISTPVILWAISTIVLPAAGASAAAGAVSWLVLLLSIEGLLRGEFLAVLGRILGVVALLVAMYYAILDWRIVVGWALAAAAVLLLIVNLRDALKR